MHGTFPIKPLAGAEIQYDLSFDRYKALGGVNFHSLETFRRSPKKSRYEQLHPTDPTPAMIEGEFIHAFVLEFQRCRQEWGILDAGLDLRTKEGKARKAALIERHGERRVVPDEAWDRAVAMHLSIINHRDAAPIGTVSGDRRTELTVQWWHAGVSLMRKMRLDCAVFEGAKECQPYDLKTVQDASFDGFRRAMFKYGWHRQAAYYMEGLRAAGVHASEFRFVAVEKTPPYCVGVYIVGPHTLKRAAAENLEALTFYRQCINRDEWPHFYGPTDGEAQLMEVYEEELYAE